MIRRHRVALLNAMKAENRHQLGPESNKVSAMRAKCYLCTLPDSVPHWDLTLAQGFWSFLIMPSKNA
jgi:hypothetical protein